MTVNVEDVGRSQSSIPHISVCICTFKRSGLLASLLRHLELQRTGDLFTYALVVVDNDSAQSARRAVAEFASSSALTVTYCVEPEENIALARNCAVATATGDLLAFIDDDEEPAAEWLLRVFQTREEYRVDGVLGPVLARLADDAPQWVKRGKFFERPRHETGHPIDWPEARTGNVLISKEVFRDLDPPFRSQFGSGGEDVDFFRRAMVTGRRFVWCDEAVVHEFVPSYRCTRGFLIRRALLRGSNFPKQAGPRASHVLKSMVAVPAYTLALPILALAGQHLFIAYLAKLSEHASRLLALAGMRLMTERET